CRNFNTQLVSNLLSQVQIDIAEHFKHFTLTNIFTFYFAQLEDIGIDNMLLLMRRLTAIEKAGLTKVIAERFTALTNLVSINTFLIAFKTTILCCWRSFSRPVIINRVRLITGLTGMYNTLM